MSRFHKAGVYRESRPVPLREENLLLREGKGKKAPPALLREGNSRVSQHTR